MRIFTLLIITMLLMACSKSSELHESMEEMGDSYKQLRKAQSADDIKAQLNGFKTAFEIAKQQPVKPEHQTDFDEGMLALEKEIASLELALTNNDLEAALASVKELHELEEKYHEKLGVED